MTVVSNCGNNFSVFLFSPTEESLSTFSKYLMFRHLEDEKENLELLFREFWVSGIFISYRINSVFTHVPFCIVWHCSLYF